MSLLLCTPVRAAELATAHVSLGYCEFRVKLARLMPSYQALCGEATFSLDVVRARNRMVGLLLSTPEFADVTHVLNVDDDQWCEDVRIVPEMVEAMLATPGLGVLGAAYTNKRQPVRWVHRVGPDGLLTGVGMGFTMISRACIERLASLATWYADAPNTLRCPNIFGQLYEETTMGTTLLSEDFSFCKRAKEAGFGVELFPQAGVIAHAGGHAWSARDMPGVVTP